MSRRSRAGLVLTGALLGSLIATTPAAATSPPNDPPPSSWPDHATMSTRLSGATNAVRVWGSDRHQTGLAISYVLRGNGGFPFTTPDRSGSWWGPGRCPRSVIVVAGDTPADALTASSLSDATDQSAEPFLQRTAAADPLFDPIGGFTRVDTDAAPILVTRSARDGATALSPAARLAAQDLRSGGCSTARQAIVIGGASAVPAGVDAELVSIGYDEVFRVEGADRYATAARVARSLGTAALPASVDECADPRSDDGTTDRTFYANSVVEHRPDPMSCELLGRTVVLADGVTGADALAAGWWTGFWQVPMLLHDGGGSLRSATAEALTTMEIDHLIVLGGAARIPVEVVDEAVGLTGARAIRVAGDDRYGTSVDMARRFGGWWPTGRAIEPSGSMLCLAASSGNAAQSRGWPDALASGPLCGALDHDASGVDAPDRAVAPLTGPHPATTASGTVGRRRGAVPVLLVPHGATQLPEVVASYLTTVFDPDGSWCSADTTSGSCATPGFAVVFGGPSAIPDDVMVEVSTIMSGTPGSDPAITPARWIEPFHTRLDMTPVFRSPGAGSDRACADRGVVTDARWVTVFADPAASQAIASSDLVASAGYHLDADGTSRTQGVSTPTCVRYSGTTSPTVRAVGPAGRAGPPTTLATDAERRLFVFAPFTSATPASTSGLDSSIDAGDGAITTWSFTTSAPSTTLQAGISTTTPTSASLSVSVRRGIDGDGIRSPATFTATFSIATPIGAVTGTASGEAIATGGAWELRGRSSAATGWGFGSTRGGFSATISTNDAGSSDDSASWRFDGNLTA